MFSTNESNVESIVPKKILTRFRNYNALFVHDGQCTATAEHTSCNKLRIDAGGELYSKSNKIETCKFKVH